MQILSFFTAITWIRSPPVIVHKDDMSLGIILGISTRCTLGYGYAESQPFLRPAEANIPGNTRTPCILRLLHTKVPGQSTHMDGALGMTQYEHETIFHARPRRSSPSPRRSISHNLPHAAPLRHPAARRPRSGQGKPARHSTSPQRTPSPPPPRAPGAMSGHRSSAPSPCKVVPCARPDRPP